MIRWFLRQMILISCGFILLILSVTRLRRDNTCLCVSLLLEHATTSEFRIIDIETGGIYSVIQHPYLGQSALTNDKHLAQYTYDDNIISFAPDNTDSFIGRYPSWSPDGQLLAYIPPTRDDNYISLFDLQSNQHITIEAAYPNSDFVWASDNDRAVYSVLYSFPVSNNISVYEVHLLDVEAKRAGRLFTADHAVTSLSWSDDNRVVYVLTSNGDIIQLDASTGDVQAQSNIEANFIDHTNVTNTRMSSNAEWLLFIEGGDTLVVINQHDGRVAAFDLTMSRVINAIWWEQS